MIKEIATIVAMQSLITPDGGSRLVQDSLQEETNIVDEYLKMKDVRENPDKVLAKKPYYVSASAPVMEEEPIHIKEMAVEEPPTYEDVVVEEFTSEATEGYVEEMYEPVEIVEEVYVPTPNTTIGLSQEEYNILAAVVQQESGIGTSYEEKRAVMSVIQNRVNQGGWWGSSYMEVITSPGQFEAYGAGHYIRHLGNIDENVHQAIQDTYLYGPSVPYTFFWEVSYADMMGRSGVDIGGNRFFNEY